MSAERQSRELYNSNNNLGASMILANVAAFPIRFGGHLSIQAQIDNGAGAAPTDAPVGTWQLWCSSDGTNFTQVTAAASELANIAATGNNLINAYAILDGVPGTSAKLIFVRSSGGGISGRARVAVTSW